MSTASEPIASPGDSSSATAAAAASAEDQARPMLPPRPTLSLVQPSGGRRHRPGRLARLIRSVFRTLPVFTPRCKPCGPILANNCHHHHHNHHHLSHGGSHSEQRRTIAGVRVTGTLFGYRKGRVNLCVQENSMCLPTLIVELAMQTQTLLRDMSSGMVRIALECEKKPDKERSSSRLLDEPLWTMFCNGKKNGYGMRREASEEDLAVMELLRAVSMGAGVLPGRSDTEGADGEIAYMRANFEHVIGSRDSETLYMMSPDGNNGPELTIFFVRI